MTKCIYKILILIGMFFAVSCAKQGMPTGGPKDVRPPEVKDARPSNRTVNFEDNTFYIEFDEYVVIKDADNNILVSPPMKNKPEYKTKGKGVQVKINDTLQPNTTYLFQFRGAIADFTEGNPIPSLEYVFSTGSYIDSMTVRGSVIDALNLSPRDATVSVWLVDPDKYDNFVKSLEDTSVAKVTPIYATRCDKKGNFSFNNIKTGDYRIVAVQDEDNNMEIGQSESVAFIDNPVAAIYIPDSAVADSGKVVTDTSQKVKLFIYTPEQEKQRITSSGFQKRGKVQFTTNIPMMDPHISTGGVRSFVRLNQSRDTVTLWTYNEKCDSLQLVVSDSSGLQDTLKLRYRTRRGEASNTSQQFTEMNLNTKTLPYFDTLRLLLKTPLDTASCKMDSVISILAMKDSVRSLASVCTDSTLMSLFVLAPFTPGEKYEVDVRKGIFKDIYGHQNDSIHASISVKGSDQYGQLRLTPSTTEATPLIVQLVDEKGKVVESRCLKSAEKVEFVHLTPAKYKVRVIVDANGNGKWDGGDFALQRLPEKVVMLPKELEVRANWEYEEELKIE